MTNPLLKDFNTPFGTAPFEEIKTEHFLPALKEAIQEGLAEIQAICDQSEAPNFSNTIIALEEAGERVGRIAEIFFNLNSAETNEEIQMLARDFSPLLSEYRNDILLNPVLFDRVKTVYQEANRELLDQEDQMLLDKSYRSFERNGAKLEAKAQKRLREIDQQLAQQSLQFGENVLAETNRYELFLNKEELIGLPDYALEAAAEEASAKGQEGKYFIGLQAPSYIPVMTYAQNRDLRKKLQLAFGSKAFKGDEYDNQESVLRIVKLRQERAELLGYKSHADYILSERMARSPQEVNDFLAKLQEVALPAAQSELSELEAYAKAKDGIDKLERWDLNYYQEKLKQERFEIDDNKLKPYFELNRVIEGAFAVANKLYGISFEERSDIQKYHPDVVTYEVKNSDGSHLAIFYADFFPREGKRNGAWMTSYRSQKLTKDGDQRPHVSIVCNFTKPGKTTPSLLTFNEVLTLFHEFGHSLHGILAKGKYASLSGTNVYWDFVELPSQIMENWCYEKECLDLFAHHFENGSALPAEWVDKLKESATFMEGYATIRQVGFAKLDMAWHNGLPEHDTVAELEESVFAETALFPAQDETNMSCSFSHIFQGGYSAGYYSYKWAEVLDADAFELFKEKGLFDTETAQKFRDLLASGGSEHPAVLYKRFRGKDPDPEALLRRAGLIELHG
ncbi:M3 family metallopeptidase [Croceimicrobium hydrocarbonivorans]|uniref:M3 family metallopeptidase n=1 Tax=Croceimicrobium hydrocarbonivorans TaxID=2761580 RepID=A0A7H0VFC6_9FLAO|nr:M3 family metallopeptidase [Croceimicrobium hydrocarbonivorans]QNR24424.1 M3 family metallopeptidase [Croceimicrobium hydrocarbonivorans]